MADSDGTGQESDGYSIRRRWLLKGIGVAATSGGVMAVSSDSALAATTGYGQSGYGAGAYGGETGSLTVVTKSATDISTTSATLNGELSDLAGADSAECFFQWRQVGASSWTKTTGETRSATGTFSKQLTGIQSGTEYEFRAAVDTADSDIVTGTTVSFTTGSYLEPVSTESPTSVTESSATLKGSLDSLDTASSADCYFEWRDVSDSWWKVTTKQTLSSTGAFSTEVDNLASDTDYEYRAVADTADGSSATGSTVSFSTKRTSTAPTIDEYSVTEAGSPNPHLDITAEWTVSDSDGDLDTVILEVNDSADRLLDAVATEITGSSASLSNNIKVKHRDGETVAVTLTVVDTLGNSDSQTESITE